MSYLTYSPATSKYPVRGFSNPNKIISPDAAAFELIGNGLVFYVDAGVAESYPGTGNTWFDLVNSYDGTFTSGISYDAANGGNLVFAGGSNQQINFSTDAALTPTVMTASIAVRIDDEARNTALWGKFNDTGFARDWSIEYYVGSGINFWFGENNPDYVSPSTGADVMSSNTWYWVTVRRDGTNADIRVNGVTTASTTYSFTPTNKGNMLAIGADGTSNNRELKGSVALAVIYDRAITNGEDNTNYAYMQSRLA